MTINESSEMYLETILVLSKKGDVRSIDIAKENYISIEKDQTIKLQPKGAEIAKTIYERHTVLTEFLEQLGVKAYIAAADACKIEHDISPESFKAIKKLVKKTKEEQK